MLRSGHHPSELDAVRPTASQLRMSSGARPFVRQMSGARDLPLTGTTCDAAQVTRDG
jgi:hypothetical protein